LPSQGEGQHHQGVPGRPGAAAKKRRSTSHSTATAASQGSAIAAPKPVKLRPLALKASRLVRFDTGSSSEALLARWVQAYTWGLGRSRSRDGGGEHHRGEQHHRRVEAQHRRHRRPDPEHQRQQPHRPSRADRRHPAAGRLEQAGAVHRSVITEGAIPFAAADPLRVIPALMVGSAVTGALVMGFGNTSRAPDGGIWVVGLIGKPVLYVLAILIGMVVTAAGVIILKSTGKKETDIEPAASRQATTTS
jgi:hypothetical protein